jgi:hypothetical protein
MFWVTDKTYFQKETQNALRGYFTLVQNPTKTELINGIYKPRLTMTKRFNTTGRQEATLSIEFSAPKLLFGNNFDELTDNDFPLVIDKLEEVLKTMGIRVFHKLLLSAPVSAVHYSKNIPLTDGTTPHYLISKIKEANIKLSLDINQTDYRNDGHSFKWHSNSYEVAFYDKIKDLEMAKKSEKRAIENDSTLQLSLFDSFQARKRLEILRIEVRLNKRQKIGQLFRMLGINSDLTFQNLFSQDISQKVLLHYLDELESKRLPLFDYKPSSPKSLLADLVIRNPKLGLKRTIQLYGLKQVFDTMTPRELRTMFNGYSQRTWYRLISDAKKINLPPTISPLNVVRQHLNSFQPLKLVDFQGIMLNNDKYN